jgi:hypothetical protein
MNRSRRSEISRLRRDFHLRPAAAGLRRDQPSLRLWLGKQAGEPRKSQQLNGVAFANNSFGEWKELGPRLKGVLPKPKASARVQGAAVSSPPSTGRFRGWGAANSWYVCEDPCKRRLPRRRISPKSADWRPPLLVSATAPQLRKL